MTKDEALKLALEALEPLVRRAAPWGELDWLNGCKAITAIKEALAQPEQEPVTKDQWLMENAQGDLERIKLVQTGVGIGKSEPCQCPNCKVTLHASDCAVHNEPAYPKGQCNCGAQPEQKPVAWKLVPIKPTDEMLKAMDECSTEGYAERLYAGHAASVYMAAVDVAPAPPQRKPLTDEEINDIAKNYALNNPTTPLHFARAIEAKLKEKNT